MFPASLPCVKISWIMAVPYLSADCPLMSSWLTVSSEVGLGWRWPLQGHLEGSALVPGSSLLLFLDALGKHCAPPGPPTMPSTVEQTNHERNPLKTSSPPKEVSFSLSCECQAFLSQ